MPAARGLPARARQPRRRRSRPTGRARSTTSTRSSSTTCASPSGAPARCSRHGQAGPPRRRAGVGRATASARSATSPARRATSTSTCSSGTTTSPASPTTVAPRSQPVRDQLDADRAAAHDELAAGLARRRTSRAALRALAAVARRRRSTRPTGGPARRPSARRRRRADASSKAQARLLEHGRAITPTTPAEDVHELRKDAKKLRYLLECFGGLLPASARKAFVKRLKALQDNLGEHQDAEVHVAQLRQAVAELPPATAAGDVRRHRPARSSSSSRRRQARPGRVRRAVRRLRQPRPTRRALRATCSTGRADEGPRDLQHQGRRRQDDRRGQPRLRGRPHRAPGCCCGTSTRRARRRSSSASSRRSRAAPSGSCRERGELADHVRATDVPGLHVLPADFSLRHLDLHLDDADARPPRRPARAARPALRRRPARLPAGHHADERGRVRRRRRAARADDPDDAVGAHARPARRVPRRRSTTRRSCCRSSR